MEKIRGSWEGNRHIRKHQKQLRLCFKFRRKTPGLIKAGYNMYCLQKIFLLFHTWLVRARALSLKAAFHQGGSAGQRKPGGQRESWTRLGPEDLPPSLSFSVMGWSRAFRRLHRFSQCSLHANLKLEAELLLLTTLKWHCSNLCGPGTSDNSNVES